MPTQQSPSQEPKASPKTSSRKQPADQSLDETGKLINRLSQMPAAEAQERMDWMLARAVNSSSTTSTFPPGLVGRVMEKHGVTEEVALDLIEAFGG
jgi:hypothetical protein